VLVFGVRSKFFFRFRASSLINFGASSSAFRSKFVGVIDSLGASYLATLELVLELYFGVLYSLEQILQEQVIVFQQHECSRNSYRAVT